MHVSPAFLLLEIPSDFGPPHGLSVTAEIRDQETVNTVVERLCPVDRLLDTRLDFRMFGYSSQKDEF